MTLKDYSEAGKAIEVIGEILRNAGNTDDYEIKNIVAHATDQLYELSGYIGALRDRRGA